MYQDYIKIEAVRIYRETNDIGKTIEEIAKHYKVKVSKRSIQYWVKEKRLDTEPALFAIESSTLVEFDPKKALETHRQAFGAEEERLRELQASLLKRLSPNHWKTKIEIETMPLKEAVSIYSKLQNLRIGKFEFIIETMPKVEGEENLLEFAEALRSAIGAPVGEPDDKSVVPDGTPQSVVYTTNSNARQTQNANGASASSANDKADE